MGKAAATAISINSSDSNSTLHPPYFEMISDAISTLKNRTGSSQQAISKVIEEKYKKSLPPNFRKTLSVQLKKLVKSERLVKVKNSFNISSAETTKVEKRGMKTKRLTQVTTPEPEGKKPPSAAAAAVAVAVGRKMKRLSQVRTPEGFKKKTRNLDLGKSPTGSGSGKEAKKKRRK